MAARRMPSSRPVRSLLLRAPKRFMRNSSGMIRSLQTMVETAVASTITIPVAAESPPTKAASARTVWPSASGSDNTKFSGSMRPGPKYSKSANAIGSTNRMISSRYSGNTQTARLRWRSSTFSTTIT